MRPASILERNLVVPQLDLSTLAVPSSCGRAKSDISTLAIKRESGSPMHDRISARALRPLPYVPLPPLLFSDLLTTDKSMPTLKATFGNETEPLLDFLRRLWHRSPLG